MLILKKLLIYSFIFIGFLIFSCNNDLSTNLINIEEFSLEYNQFGGIAGINNTLTISESDSVFYKSYNCNFFTILDEEEISSLFNNLVDNHFFSLDSAFLPDRPIMDDTIFKITYKSNSISKTIIASGYCSNHCPDAKWPNELHTIFNYLEKLIIDIKSRINSGKVTISSKSVLEEWPFSDIIKLSDNLNKNVDADEEIFNHFKEYYEQDKHVIYFEGEWIYCINSSGGYSLNFNELSSFYISIHGRNMPIYWPFEIKLADISEMGIILSGQDYNWIKEKLIQTHYPEYFMDMDDSLASGAFLYEINLLHGNIL